MIKEYTVLPCSSYTQAMNSVSYVRVVVCDSVLVVMSFRVVVSDHDSSCHLELEIQLFHCFHL